MFRPLPIGRAVLFAAVTIFAACGPEEHGDVLVDDTSDALREEPEDESRLCAELACPSDQICVVPPVLGDDSGDPPSSAATTPFTGPSRPAKASPSVQAPSSGPPSSPPSSAMIPSRSALKRTRVGLLSTWAAPTSTSPANN